MPDRIIRSAILSSDAVSRLSWAAEVFYRRLMSVADDHGRYDGRIALLRAVLYPLQLTRVSEPDIGKWIRETEEAGLVRKYSVDGKDYLAIAKFGQKIRSKSKWPEPPTIVGKCPQVPTDVPVCVVVSEGVSESAPKSRKRSRAPLPENFGLSERVIEWAKAKGYGRLQEHLDAFRLKAVANDYRYADWDAALMQAIEADWARLNSKPKPVDPFAGAI